MKIAPFCLKPGAVGSTTSAKSATARSASSRRPSPPSGGTADGLAISPLPGFAASIGFAARIRAGVQKRSASRAHCPEERAVAVPAHAEAVAGKTTQAIAAMAKQAMNERPRVLTRSAD